MPTRRPSPTTDQSALSRAVVKKSTPVGRDCALVLPPRPPNHLNYRIGTCGSHWWLTPTLTAVGIDSLNIFDGKKTRAAPVVLWSAS